MAAAAAEGGPAAAGQRGGIFRPPLGEPLKHLQGGGGRPQIAKVSESPEEWVECYPSHWAISLKQLQTLNASLRSYYESREDDFSTKNLRQVVRDFVIPETSGKGMGYALMVNQTAPLEAKVMISHCWDENYEAFTKAIIGKAADINAMCGNTKLPRPSQAPRKGLKAKTTTTDLPEAPPPGVWICALANFQRSAGDTSGPSIQEQLGNDVMKSPFAQIISTAAGMIVVQTHEAPVYERMWCVLELFVSIIEVKPVHLVGDWNVDKQWIAEFDPSAASCGAPGDWPGPYRVIHDGLSVQERASGFDNVVVDRVGAQARINVLKVEKQKEGDTEVARGLILSSQAVAGFGLDICGSWSLGSATYAIRKVEGKYIFEAPPGPAPHSSDSLITNASGELHFHGNVVVSGVEASGVYRRSSAGQGDVPVWVKDGDPDARIQLSSSVNRWALERSGEALYCVQWCADATGASFPLRAEWTTCAGCSGPAPKIDFQSSVLVSDAGSPGANGLYSRVPDEEDGTPVWASEVDPQYSVRWSRDSAGWVLLHFAPLYRTGAVDEDCPPWGVDQAKWSVCEGGQHPVPALTLSCAWCLRGELMHASHGLPVGSIRLRPGGGAGKLASQVRVAGAEWSSAEAVADRVAGWITLARVETESGHEQRFAVKEMNKDERAIRDNIVGVVGGDPQAAGFLCPYGQVAHEGAVSPEHDIPCVASFPGRYADSWNEAISKHCFSTACVFLGRAGDDLGQHAQDPENPKNACYCQTLYGKRSFQRFGYLLTLKEGATDQERKALLERANAMHAVVVEENASSQVRSQKEAEARDAWEQQGKVAAWGCKWFAVWKSNIETAVARNQRLVVYYLQGGRGIGEVPWDRLASPDEDLWDDIGLGASQKCEVAHLDRLGVRYEKSDLADFLLEFGCREAAEARAWSRIKHRVVDGLQGLLVETTGLGKWLKQRMFDLGISGIQRLAEIVEALVVEGFPDIGSLIAVSKAQREKLLRRIGLAEGQVQILMQELKELHLVNTGLGAWLTQKLPELTVGLSPADAHGAVKKYVDALAGIGFSDVCSLVALDRTQVEGVLRRAGFQSKHVTQLVKVLSSLRDAPVPGAAFQKVMCLGPSTFLPLSGVVSKERADEASADGAGDEHVALSLPDENGEVHVVSTTSHVRKEVAEWMGSGPGAGPQTWQLHLSTAQSQVVAVPGFVEFKPRTEVVLQVSNIRIERKSWKEFLLDHSGHVLRKIHAGTWFDVRILTASAALKGDLRESNVDREALRDKSASAAASWVEKLGMGVRQPVAQVRFTMKSAKRGSKFQVQVQPCGQNADAATTLSKSELSKLLEELEELVKALPDPGGDGESWNCCNFQGSDLHELRLRDAVSEVDASTLGAFVGDLLDDSHSLWNIIVELEDALLDLDAEFDFTFDTTETELGIKFVRRGDRLIVRRVSNGVVAEWNAGNPEMKVQRGNVLQEVNGIKGDPDMMLQECSASKQLLLTLRRASESSIVRQVASSKGWQRTRTDNLMASMDANRRLKSIIANRNVSDLRTLLPEVHNVALLQDALKGACLHQWVQHAAEQKVKRHITILRHEEAIKEALDGDDSAELQAQVNRALRRSEDEWSSIEIVDLCVTMMHEDILGLKLDMNTLEIIGFAALAAQRHDWRRGDRIMAVDGRSVSDGVELCRVLGDMQEGSYLIVRVHRSLPGLDAPLLVTAWDRLKAFAIEADAHAAIASRDEGELRRVLGMYTEQGVQKEQSQWRAEVRALLSQLECERGLREAIAVVDIAGLHTFLRRAELIRDVDKDLVLSAQGLLRGIEQASGKKARARHRWQKTRTLWKVGVSRSSVDVEAEASTRKPDHRRKEQLVAERQLEAKRFAHKKWRLRLGPLKHCRKVWAKMAEADASSRLPSRCRSQGRRYIRSGAGIVRRCRTAEQGGLAAAQAGSRGDDGKQAADEEEEGEGNDADDEDSDDDAPDLVEAYRVYRADVIGEGGVAGDVLDQEKEQAELAQGFANLARLCGGSELGDQIKLQGLQAGTASFAVLCPELAEVDHCHSEGAEDPIAAGNLPQRGAALPFDPPPRGREEAARTWLVDPASLRSGAGASVPKPALRKVSVPSIQGFVQRSPGKQDDPTKLFTTLPSFRPFGSPRPAEKNLAPLASGPATPRMPALPEGGSRAGFAHGHLGAILAFAPTAPAARQSEGVRRIKCGEPCEMTLQVFPVKVAEIRQSFDCGPERYPSAFVALVPARKARDCCHYSELTAATLASAELPNLWATLSGFTGSVTVAVPEMGVEEAKKLSKCEFRLYALAPERHERRHESMSASRKLSSKPTTLTSSGAVASEKGRVGSVHVQLRPVSVRAGRRCIMVGNALECRLLSQPSISDLHRHVGRILHGDMSTLDPAKCIGGEGQELVGKLMVDEEELKPATVVTIERAMLPRVKLALTSKVKLSEEDLPPLCPGRPLLENAVPCGGAAAERRRRPETFIEPGETPRLRFDALAGCHLYLVQCKSSPAGAAAAAAAAAVDASGGIGRGVDRCFCYTVSAPLEGGPPASAAAEAAGAAAEAIAEVAAASAAGETLTCDLPGLPPGRFRCSVRAKNKNGYGVWSRPCRPFLILDASYATEQSRSLGLALDSNDPARLHALLAEIDRLPLSSIDPEQVKRARERLIRLEGARRCERALLVAIEIGIGEDLSALSRALQQADSIEDLVEPELLAAAHQLMRAHQQQIEAELERAMCRAGTDVVTLLSLMEKANSTPGISASVLEKGQTCMKRAVCEHRLNYAVECNDTAAVQEAVQMASDANLGMADKADEALTTLRLKQMRKRLLDGISNMSEQEMEVLIAEAAEEGNDWDCLETLDSELAAARLRLQVLICERKLNEAVAAKDVPGLQSAIKDAEDLAPLCQNVNVASFKSMDVKLFERACAEEQWQQQVAALREALAEGSSDKVLSQLREACKVQSTDDAVLREVEEWLAENTPREDRARQPRQGLGAQDLLVATAMVFQDSAGLEATLAEIGDGPSTGLCEEAQARVVVLQNNEKLQAAYDGQDAEAVRSVLDEVRGACNSQLQRKAEVLLKRLEVGQHICDIQARLEAAALEGNEPSADEATEMEGVLNSVLAEAAAIEGGLGGDLEEGARQLLEQCELRRCECTLEQAVAAGDVSAMTSLRDKATSPHLKAVRKRAHAAIVQCRLDEAMAGTDPVALRVALQAAKGVLDAETIQQGQQRVAVVACKDALLNGMSKSDQDLLERGLQQADGITELDPELPDMVAKADRKLRELKALEALKSDDLSSVDALVDQLQDDDDLGAELLKKALAVQASLRLREDIREAHACGNVDSLKELLDKVNKVSFVDAQVVLEAQSFLIGAIEEELSQVLEQQRKQRQRRHVNVIAEDGDGGADSSGEELTDFGEEEVDKKISHALELAKGVEGVKPELLRRGSEVAVRRVSRLLRGGIQRSNSSAGFTSLLRRAERLSKLGASAMDADLLAEARKKQAVLKCQENLKHAMNEQDLDKLREALEEAGQVGYVCETLLEEAQKLMNILDCRIRLKTTQDSKSLQQAIDDATLMKLEVKFMLPARERLKAMVAREREQKMAKEKKEMAAMTKMCHGLRDACASCQSADGEAALPEAYARLGELLKEARGMENAGKSPQLVEVMEKAQAMLEGQPEQHG